MPRSPQWMDMYQIWFRGSSRRRNQLCGSLLQSAHGFQFCEGSKFAISHWLDRSPLTQCWRYRAACDNKLPTTELTCRCATTLKSSTFSSPAERKRSANSASLFHIASSSADVSPNDQTKYHHHHHPSFPASTTRVIGVPSATHSQH